MAECFPGNPAWEGCSPILSVNALVPIVLAPGAHVWLQIIFLLKAKEQKPKKHVKLDNNIIQAHLQEIQHSRLYHCKNHEDNTRDSSLCFIQGKRIIFPQENSYSLTEWSREGMFQSNDVFGFSKFYLI